MKEFPWDVAFGVRVWAWVLGVSGLEVSSVGFWLEMRGLGALAHQTHGANLHCELGPRENL